MNSTKKNQDIPLLVKKAKEDIQNVIKKWIPNIPYIEESSKNFYNINNTNNNNKYLIKEDNTNNFSKIISIKNLLDNDDNNNAIISSTSNSTNVIIQQIANYLMPFLKKLPQELMKYFTDPNNAVNKYSGITVDFTLLLSITNALYETNLMYDNSIITPLSNTIINMINKQFGFLSPYQKKVFIPQNDPDLSIRHRIIEARRFNFNYTNEIRLGNYFGQPLNIGFPIYNRVAPYTLSEIPILSDADSIGQQLSYTANLAITRIISEISSTMVSMNNTTNFSSLEDYVKILEWFGVNIPIVINNINNINNWLNDVEFGRQRLQGISPEIIFRINKTIWNEKNYQQKLSLTKEILSKFYEIMNITLEKAIEQEIIYCCDFSILDCVYLQNLTRSHNRYISAPIALFYYDRKLKKLMPLCIQLFPNNDNRKEEPIWYPDGSLDWLLAKLWVQAAEAQYNEIIIHLFECHLISENIMVASFRQLGDSHPVLQILKPHFIALLQINTFALNEMLARDGAVNKSIGPGPIGAAYLISEVFKTWNFTEKSFKKSLKNRGFLNNENPDKIEGYFWRDDGLKLYGIIEKFVKSCLDLYYKKDEDIKQDWEIQAWVKELQSERGGKLKGISSNEQLKTLEELVTFLTNIIFTITAKHSQGNSGQFDYYGFVPNGPGCLYIPPIIEKGKTNWTTIMQALPPKIPTLVQVVTVYLLADIMANLPMLGEGVYPVVFQPLVEQFKKELKQLSVMIQTREKVKPFPYLYLDPARIGNSIYI
jgi:hypothetical protein